MRALARISCVAAAALLFAGDVLANGTAPEPASPDLLAIQRYGDVNKTCVVWTDGCRNCNRDESGAPVCSNIGISCQPAAIVCSKRKDTAPAKK